MNNVLITGASGFIGSFLVEEGLKRHFQVYAGIRSTSSKEYLKDPRIHLLEMDYSSTGKMVEILRDLKTRGIRFRYIVHNAGITKAVKKDDFYNVNVRNTQNFIEALIQTGMIPEKFIYISSLAAMGPGDPHTMKPVLLSDPPHPVEAYGKSKLEAEQYIKKQDYFPWLIFRPTGVYGPREKDYFVFFKTIQSGFEPYIGSKRQIISFIYVRDLVRLIYDAMNSPVIRHSYFVSDGLDYDTRTFAAITKKILNKRTIRIIVPPIIVKLLASGLESLYGIRGLSPTLNRDKYMVFRSPNWRCEVEPLQHDFRFVAEYDLEKGVAETIDWYKKEHWL